MKQVFLRMGKGDVVVEDIPPPALKAGGVIVRNAFSLISAGTERASISAGGLGIIQKARERPDLVRKVIDSFSTEGLTATYYKVMAKLSGFTPIGYSSSGIVQEVGEGAGEFSRGDRVACAGVGYANHAQIVFVPKNLSVCVPDGVRLDHAAFTTIGAIALHGVRQSGAVLGERVAVIGLGLVGLLAVQILRAGGVRVIGLDIDEERVRLSQELGADAGVVIGKDDEAAVTRAFTNNLGVDAAVITAATKSSEPIVLAGNICRDRGRIVVVGDVGMQIPRDIFYRKELSLVLSRSYGPGRYDPLYEEGGIDYPPGYVRWTEARNMKEFLELVKAGKVNVERLITHRFALDEASRAYDLLAGRKNERYLGILLTYGMEEPVASKVLLRPAPKYELKGKLSIGFIGAGAFAQSVLLPALKDVRGVILKGVATATGVSGKKVAQRFGFEYCTTQSEEILNDQGIDTVFIATRHNLHAPIAIAALRKGKAVFMEKPMAINEPELGELLKVWRETGGRLMVGFNRRFSPLIGRMKAFFSGRKEPLQMIYRVNAGFLPKDHWVHDPREGGGRIIGEVCHFVDLLCFLTDSRPVRVFAENIPSSGDALSEDNVTVTLKFSDGSWGTIAYIARGDSALPKEMVEVFCGGATAILNDFRTISLYREGREKREGKTQEKGHRQEMEAFVSSVLGGGPMPNDVELSALVTQTTYRIEESIKKGLPIDINPISLSPLPGGERVG